MKDFQKLASFPTNPRRLLTLASFPSNQGHLLRRASFPTNQGQGRRCSLQSSESRRATKPMAAGVGKLLWYSGLLKALLSRLQSWRYVVTSMVPYASREFNLRNSSPASEWLRAANFTWSLSRPPMFPPSQMRSAFQSLYGNIASSSWANPGGPESHPLPH